MLMTAKLYHFLLLLLLPNLLTVLAISRTLNSPPLCFFSNVLALLLRPLRFILRYSLRISYSLGLTA